jgi:hypothetical protein
MGPFTCGRLRPFRWAASPSTTCYPRRREVARRMERCNRSALVLDGRRDKADATIRTPCGRYASEQGNLREARARTRSHRIRCSPPPHPHRNSRTTPSRRGDRQQRRTRWLDEAQLFLGKTIEMWRSMLASMIPTAQAEDIKVRIVLGRSRRAPSRPPACRASQKTQFRLGFRAAAVGQRTHTRMHAQMDAPVALAVRRPFRAV